MNLFKYELRFTDDYYLLIQLHVNTEYKEKSEFDTETLKI